MVARVRKGRNENAEEVRGRGGVCWLGVTQLGFTGRWQSYSREIRSRVTAKRRMNQLTRRLKPTLRRCWLRWAFGNGEGDGVLKERR
jgi:hypothetical protein